MATSMLQRFSMRKYYTALRALPMRKAKIVVAGRQDLYPLFMPMPEQEPVPLPDALLDEDRKAQPAAAAVSSDGLDVEAARHESSSLFEEQESSESSSSSDSSYSYVYSTASKAEGAGGESRISAAPTTTSSIGGTTASASDAAFAHGARRNEARREHGLPMLGSTTVIRAPPSRARAQGKAAGGASGENEHASATSVPSAQGDGAVDGGDASASDAASALLVGSMPRKVRDPSEGANAAAPVARGVGRLADQPLPSAEDSGAGAMVADGHLDAASATAAKEDEEEEEEAHKKRCRLQWSDFSRYSAKGLGHTCVRC